MILPLNDARLLSRLGCLWGRDEGFGFFDILDLKEIEDMAGVLRPLPKLPQAVGVLLKTSEVC